MGAQSISDTTARAQAEIDSGCIGRLADLAQDGTILENKQFHFEYSNICGAEVMAMLWRSVSTCKLIPY